MFSNLEVEENYYSVKEKKVTYRQLENSVATVKIILSSSNLGNDSK